MNLTELLRLAILIEEKGYLFYSKLSGQIRDQHIRQTIEKLADDEKTHVKQFKTLLGDVSLMQLNNRGDLEKFNLSRIWSEEALNNLKAAGPQAEIPQSWNEALQLGIQAEKDSILFYHELFYALPEGSAKSAVGKLLKEEEMHLLELRAYLEDEN